MQAIKITNTNKKIMVAISVVLAVILVFLSFNNFLFFTTGIDGENHYIEYDGLVVNGGILKYYGDSMTFDWKIDNRGDYVIDDWLLWAKVKDPTGDYKFNTYYGEGSILPDIEINVTQEFTDVWVPAGTWTLTTLTLEGNLYDMSGNLVESDVVIDRIDDRSIWVVNVPDVDYSFNVYPGEIDEWETVSVEYDATNSGNAAIGLIVEAFVDKDLDHVRDSGEKWFVNVYKDPCPVGDGLEGIGTNSLVYDDTNDGVATICCHIIAYSLSGPVPDAHIYEDTTIIVHSDQLPPVVSIEINAWVIPVAAGLFSLLGVALIMFRKTIFGV